MSESLDVTLERLNGLEASLASFRDHVDARFDGIESALGKMVNVLEAHDARLEQISIRLDRPTDATVRARTQDTERMTELEDRLAALEQRNDATP